MKNLRCSACGGEKLSPVAALSLPVDPPNPKWPALALGGFGGWLGTESFWIKAARVCGECGHVMLFLDDSARAKLAEHWDDLTPARIAED